MTKLHIGNDFSLPLDFVTQSQAILAKKRVGKSYTASVQAEELLKAGQQICVIDPTGAWWGLKSSADGKHEGFQIAVFGGEHADVPLEESAGETIAQAIVEQRFSAIIDLTLFRKGQVNRFMAPFLETLYRLNRDAMHLFVDEADAIAPQKPFGEEARMLGAMEDVVRRGGIRGIGTTLITQRPAVLNKNVLTQCEILCALRIVHHKDIDAIHEWIEVHGDPELAEKMIASLPSLPIGTAWFWAPGWGDLFQKVEIRKRETFDSGATPKPGETKRTAKVLASIDLQKLGEQIQATVQRAKENDPKQLRAEIARLRKELEKPQKAAQPVIDQKAIDRAVKAATTPLIRQIEDARQQARKAVAQLLPLTNIEVQHVEVDTVLSNRNGTTGTVGAQIDFTPVGAAPRSPIPINGNSDLTGPEQRILNAIAWLNSIGVQDPEQAAVAFLAGYTIGGGAFNNPRGRLNQRGLVEYLPGERIRLTVDGAQLAQAPDTPLDAEEIQQRILERLPGPERKILSVLIQEREGLPNDELAARAGYADGGGAYNNPRGRLRSLGLIEYQSGKVVPKSLLFLES